MTAPELLPGRIVAGKYTIQTLLKRHAWATTYRAITMPNREVAIKMIDPALSAPGLGEATKRTQAMLTAVPEHLALPVLEHGNDPDTGAPFLVTPLSAHPSLEQLVELCALPPAEMVTLMQKLGQAIDAVHGAGLAHLALKPANLFVGPTPHYSVQIGDFGASAIRAAVPENVRLSFEAPWCAPEQVQNAQVGPPADVFAAALIAFFSLTGKSFWRACNWPNPNVGAWTVEMAAPRNRASAQAAELGVALSPAFDHAFLRALHPSPSERFRTVGELAHALAQALEGAGEAYAPAPVVTEGLFAPALKPHVLTLQPPAPVLSAAAAQPWPAPESLAQGASDANAPPAPEWEPTLPRARGRAVWIAVSVGLFLVAAATAMALGRGAPNKGRAAQAATAPGLPSAAAVRLEPTASAPARAVAAPSSVAPTDPSIAVAVPSTPPVASSKVPSGQNLTVVCEPACDTVLIDGKRMDSYPEGTTVASGLHGIGVARAQYGGQWKQVTVRPGVPQTVSFTLLPGSAPTSAPKKPCGKFLKRCPD